MPLTRMGALTVLAGTLLGMVDVPAALGQAGPEDGAATPAASPGTNEIRFTFKDAPLDQVLDFFNRETGLPVIRKTEAKGAPITFISPSSYDLDEALRILNIILQTQGIHLYRDTEFLYLEKLDRMIAAPVPTFPEGQVPDGLTGDQVISVVIPLNNATSKAIEEQLKPLISSFGALVALPQQNAVILTETAAQCRRVRSIIDMLDSKPVYEDAVRVFPLANINAADAMASLKVLVAEKQKTVVIDGQGNRRVIEEDNITGVRLEANAQTNSIIAVGPAGRLQTIEQLLDLLDVSGAGSGTGREMATFALNTISAEEARSHVERLFGSMPEDRRPTLVPLSAVGKLTIVGSIGSITQAGALLSELDGATTDDGPLGRVERRGTVMALEHVTAREAMQVLERLLSQRQQRTLSIAPAPDQRGLIVVGPSGDVDAVSELLTAVDRQPDVVRDVRIIRLSESIGEDLLARAQELYAATGLAEREPVTVTVEEGGQTAVLVGGKSAIERFVGIMQSAEQTFTIAQETRTHELSHVAPSAMVQRLDALSRPLLTPADGTTFVAPRFEAIDDLGMLIVRALPEQQGVLDRLIETLDTASGSALQLRVLDLGVEDPVTVADRTMELYASMVEGLPPTEQGVVSYELDRASGKLIVTADRIGMDRFTGLLSQVQQLTPPARTTNLIEIKYASAADVAGGLQELLSTTPPVDPARAVDPPDFRVIDRTNSIIITAEDAQHRLINDYIRRLDVLEPAEVPPLKLLQVRTADAVQVAGMLTAQYDRRSAEERREQPVDIRADGATNTLVVSAHEALFDEIRAFVDDLNQDPSQAARVTEIFPLKVAKAENVARAMDQLYPMPPIPLDRRGNPMPWLREPREVNVSADPASNALIVDAPAERMAAFKALVEKLDRVELPPTAELRTYSIERADLDAVSRTLQALARHGSLGGKAEPGKPAVPVTVEAEPRSGTLIIGGDARTHELVERILVDLGRVSIERELRIVRIENADPEGVREQAMEIYSQQTAQVRSAQPVDVTVDEASRSLMVVAETEAMARFLRILDQLEMQAGPPRELRLTELQHADATQVVAFLNDLLETSRSFDVGLGIDPVFEPVGTTNSLLVAAQPDQHAIIDALVQSIDVPDEARAGPLRILRLRTADADNIARVLQQSYAQRSAEERAERPVNIRADQNTNMLIVSAHPEMLAEIEQLVSQFNEAQAYDSEGREIRIYPLKIARAEELARTLDQMFPEPPVPVDRFGRPQNHLRQPREVVVRADRQTNSIIVDAPAKRLAGFEQLVAQLDRTEITGDLELRTYRIEHADLDAIAATLRTLATSGGFDPTDSGSRQREIVIQSEPVSRTLVVSGPSSVFPHVERVIDELDALPEAPETQMLFFALQHARAERVQPLLNRLLTARLVQQRDELESGAYEVERLIDVAADPATNTVILTVPTALVDVSRELIARLDSETASVGQEVIRIVPLTFADPRETAQTLSQSLRNANLPSGGTGSAVTITAASASNALVISGVAEDLDFVTELLDDLDTRPTQDTLSVRTFRLDHARAEEVAPTVQRLLVDQRAADPRVIAARIRSSRGRFDGDVPINVEAEPRTNALIVSGPAVIVDLAEEIVATLDQESGQDRSVEVFTPARANPNALIDTTRRLVDATVPSRDPVQLSIDKATGGILVIGTDEQVAVAMTRLRELDEQAVEAPELELQTFSLQYAAAQAVSRSVEPMLRDRTYWPDTLRRLQEAGGSVVMPTISADDANNRLLVSAPAQLMPIARQFISALDREPTGGAVEVRVFPLQKSTAESVAAALSKGLAAGSRPGQPVPVVTAEPASNTVIVAASSAQVQQAAELIKPMDVSIEPDLPGVRTVFLEHARAEQVAPVVSQLLSGREMSEWMRLNLIQRRMQVDEGPDVRVVAEERLNAVVISAPVSLLEAAEEMVHQLDQPLSTTARPVRLIPLRNVEAAAIANNLEDLFIADTTGGPEPVIRVDNASNTLIVRATNDQFTEIRDLVEGIDSNAIVGSRQIRMIPVDRSRSDAGAMAETIRQLLQQRSGVSVEVISVDELMGGDPPDSDDDPEDIGFRSIGEESSEAVTRRILVPPRLKLIIGYVQTVTAAAEDGEADVTIAVDPATNALIVVGSDRATQRIAELVAAIEQDLPPEPGRIRVIRLPEGVNGNTLANLLRATVRELGRSEGGLTGRVAVIPDPQGDSIIVAANDTDFATIREVTRSLIQPGDPQSLTIKVYELTSVSADRAVRAVQDMLSSNPRGWQGRQFRDANPLEITLAGTDGAVETASIDASQVRVSAGPSGTSLVVAAPRDAIAFLDGFVGLIDQTTFETQSLIREYTLKNARANEIAQVLQTTFDAARGRIRGNQETRARFVADRRSNTVLVTASDDQHREAERLIQRLDTPVDDETYKLTVIPLDTARARELASMLNRTVVGDDESLRRTVVIEGNDAIGALLVRAPDEQLLEIQTIVAEVDQPAADEYPVQAIKLERADAGQVAASLRQLFDERARAATRPGQRTPPRRVAITGDRRSATVFVSASDEDLEEIRGLIETFDAPATARDLQFRVVTLEHAMASDLEDTVVDLANEFRWSRWGQDDSDIFVQVNARTNSIVLMGKGESFEAIESIIRTLDTAEAGSGGMTVRFFAIENADLDILIDVLEEAFPDPNRNRWWRNPTGAGLQFRVDNRSRRLIVIGPESQMDGVAELVADLDAQAIPSEHEVTTVALSFGEATRVAQSVNRFFQDRARREGGGRSEVSVIGSADGNVIILSAPEADMALARDIIARLDAPEVAEDRRIEVYALQHGEARDIADAIRGLFPRRRGSVPPVYVTPDNRTNAIIVSAADEVFPQVEELIARMDAPSDADIVMLQTFQLATARADEAAQTLREALALDQQATGRAGDLQGRVRRFVDASGQEVEIRATITPDRRANALIVSADEPSMDLIARLITELDEKPTVSEIEYRVIELEHAVAPEIELTVERLLRKWADAANEPSPTVSSSVRDNTLIIAATANQLREVDRILSQLDVASESNRTTDFVPLRFADAEQTREALSVFYGRYAPEADTPGARNVSIVADPATNSLVVSADEAEWPGIRKILEIFDSEEYDSSRQLEVIPLAHADAQSVASAINAAFESTVRTEIERQRQQQQQQNQRQQRDDRFGPIVYDAPAVLVPPDEIVSVSAEAMTNSLIVSAGRKDLERVRRIVEQLDVPEFENTPTPRLIVVRHGKASDLAHSLREMYVQMNGNRVRSSRSVLIVGDDAASALIVRAEESEFRQIAALAESLQAESADSRITVRVIPLRTQSAVRLATTVRNAFSAAANQLGEQLSIEVDRRNNALLIGSSQRLFEEIEQVVTELDGVEGPGADLINGLVGQELLIVELRNTGPSQVADMLNQMGVTRQVRDDQPALVSEPVVVVPMTTRRAVAVLVSPADRATLASLIETIDAEPATPQQEMVILPLAVADAQNVASTLEAMLKPENDSGVAMAEAVREQMRRLHLNREGVGAEDVDLDLSVPIRITPERQTNAVVVTSTPENVLALREIVELLDRLPVGDAVIVRIFHLENAAAARISSVVKQLFQQGEALRRSPGSTVSGLPTTETGRALAGEIAVAVDDRTNALVVAGREEAVALAEVLIGELDSDNTANWIEPRLIELRHADAVELAETLNRILVQGLGETPEAASIQRQIGRLRVLRDGAADGEAVESFLFAPMSNLVILPEDQLNALVVVGANANVDVVAELVDMLDVSGAARTDMVRLYPLEFAAADRVGDILEGLFEDQRRSGTIREEDDVVIESDLRTNTLIIATSPRSFAVIDNLLMTLDSDELNATVGLHVIPVRNNDAEQLARKLEPLMKARLDAAQGDGRSRRDIISIEADRATNSLIVAASDENFSEIERLIDLLSAEEPVGDGLIELFPLQTAKADDISELLDELYVQEARRTRGDGALRVFADERLNAVVVNGLPSDIEQIRDLISRLDTASVSTVREIKVLQLRSANALEIVNLLEQVLGENSLAGRRSTSRQATLLRLVREQSEQSIEEATGRKPTETEINFAIREQVTLTPDLRTNALIVSAPPPMMVLIEALVETIDSSEEGDRDIVVFTLDNADAENLAEMLRDLFRLSQQGNIYLLVPSRIGGGPVSASTDPNEGIIGTGVNVVPDERQQLSITVDARTNSLLVSGTPQYLELVGRVIRELDAKPGAERKQTTVQLKNARVEEVADALNTFINQEQERIARTLGPDRQGSLVRRLEQEISVVGVPGSSRIILSASPRYMNRVLELIDELDKPPSQVLIQVMLAEVTLDSEQSWGVDLTIQPQGRDMFTGFTRAAGTGVLTAIGVPNLSVSSIDFDLLIRALEVQGRLEVLSRPQILVNDNEDARIQVGEEIQLVTNVERLDNGNVRSDVEPRELGVILEVTPSISPDGFVRLDIAPQISALTTRTTQVSEDFEAPVISQRRANTTVTVQDGQTIVIGGLIQNSTDSRDTKVPLLGDIPLIGAVFQSKRATQTKTELLIVITPRVIPSDETLLDLTLEEVEMLNLAEDMKERLRRRILGQHELGPIIQPEQK